MDTSVKTSGFRFPSAMLREPLPKIEHANFQRFARLQSQSSPRGAPQRRKGFNKTANSLIKQINRLILPESRRRIRDPSFWKKRDGPRGYFALTTGRSAQQVV